ncbi:hypothetical protein [Companilactobacillus ginsenosidimutans]|nr:hypothetical protein [Companilactobacillus ginsenosidimutans]
MNKIVEWVIELEEEFGNMRNVPENHPTLMKIRAEDRIGNEMSERAKNFRWDYIQKELDSGTPKRTIIDLYEINKTEFDKAMRFKLINDIAWKRVRRAKTYQKYVDKKRRLKQEKIEQLRRERIHGK